MWTFTAWMRCGGHGDAPAAERPPLVLLPLIPVLGRLVRLDDRPTHERDSLHRTERDGESDA